MTSGTRWAMLVSLAALTACGEKSAPAPSTSGDSPATAPAIAATGTVVEIKAITDDKGNRFEPNEVEVHRGDVLRVVLVSGVHNISFPAEKNPGAAGPARPERHAPASRTDPRRADHVRLRATTPSSATRTPRSA